jgi:hypothetical protein
MDHHIYFLQRLPNRIGLCDISPHDFSLSAEFLDALPVAVIIQVKYTHLESVSL